MTLFLERVRIIEMAKELATILFRGIELKILKQKLGHLLESRKSVLDLGCGDGTATSVIFDEPIDYGLDNDPLTIKQAEKSGYHPHQKMKKAYFKAKAQAI